MENLIRVDTKNVSGGVEVEIEFCKKNLSNEQVHEVRDLLMKAFNIIKDANDTKKEDFNSRVAELVVSALKKDIKDGNSPLEGFLKYMENELKKEEKANA